MSMTARAHSPLMQFDSYHKLEARATRRPCQPQHDVCATNKQQHSNETTQGPRMQSIAATDARRHPQDPGSEPPGNGLSALASPSMK